MANGDIIRLAINGQGPNGLNVNVLHFRQIVEGTELNVAQACAAAWFDEGLTPFKATFSSRLAVTLVQARGVIQTGPLEAFDFPIVAGNGSQGATDLLPGQDSAVMALKSGQAGRSKNGRQYMWPILEANQVDGKITAAQVTAIENYGNAILTIVDPASGAEFELVVYSRKNISAVPVTTITVNALIGSQRRRREGVGA